MARLVGIACGYAVGGWIAFTGLLVLVGDVVLPEIRRPLTPLVVVGLTLLTAVAVAALSLDYFRRAGRADAVSALALGVAIAGLGLTLDGLLLLATEFRYPNVEVRRMPTLAVALMLGYGTAAVVPGLVAAFRGRGSRRPIEGADGRDTGR